MAFSRDDLKTYETQTPVMDPNHDPWSPRDTKDVLNPEADPQAKAEASPDPSPEDVTEPAAQGDDGSTTENQAESVAAADATPEGEKDPDPEDLADGKPRSRAQERIEELVAERNALRKYGEYLLTQVDEMRKAPAKPVAESQPAHQDTVVDDTAPTLESAEYDPVKLTKMQTEWIQKQVEKRVESAVKQIESRQSEVATRQAFENRTAEFRKTAPDFDVVISNPALPQLAPDAARVVVRSDNGPDIIYHLGKNPDLAVRIARMDAASQSAAIGRLEEQLVRAKADAVNAQKEPSKVTKAPAKVTKAPPPPKPVSSSSGVVSKPESIMTMDEWVATERNRKIAEKQARIKMRNAMR